MLYKYVIDVRVSSLRTSQSVYVNLSSHLIISETCANWSSAHFPQMLNCAKLKLEICLCVFFFFAGALLLAILYELARWRSAISADWGGCSWGSSLRLSAVAPVCSLIRVCRKLSLIVSDDVVRVIREARVGVSVKCNASVKEKGKEEAKWSLISDRVENISKSSASYLPELYFLFLLFVCMCVCATI